MAWLFLLIALVWSAPALACTPVACPAPVRTFGEQNVVPGNLVYFKVLQEPNLLTLSVEGTLVPASIRMVGRDRVFVPDAPIPGGKNVVLRWRYECPARPGEEVAGEYAFITLGAAPLRVEPRQAFVYEVGLRKFIGDPAESYARLQVSSTQYSHLFDTVVSVDGAALRPRENAYNYELSSQCLDGIVEPSFDTCGGLLQVPLGTHAVTVTTRIIGTDTDPAPVSLSVTTSCDDVSFLAPDASIGTMPPLPPLNSDPWVDPVYGMPMLPSPFGPGAGDAPKAPTDAGVMVDAALEADAGPAPEYIAAPSAHDDGCRLARSRFDGAWLALALLLRRRKRQ